MVPIVKNTETSARFDRGVSRLRRGGKIEIQRLGASLLITLLFFEVPEALEGPQKK